MDARSSDVFLSILNFAFGSVSGFDEQCQPVRESVKVLSPAVRAGPDLLAFMGVFGVKTLFEEKVPAGNRKAFNSYIMKRHSDPSAMEEFAAAWKDWLKGNQEELSDMDDEDEDEDSDAMDLYGTAREEKPATPSTPEGGAGGAGGGA